LFAEVV